MKLQDLHSYKPALQAPVPKPTPLADKESKADFFTALTKYNRILAGVPQEYGFHEHNADGYRGSFCVGGYRGLVKKARHGDITTYTCTFPKDNVRHKHQRMEDILTAIQAAAPNQWRFLSLRQLRKDPDPCYAVEMVDEDHDGDVDVVVIYVKHDDHEGLKYYD